MMITAVATESVKQFLKTELKSYISQSKCPTKRDGLKIIPMHYIRQLKSQFPKSIFLAQEKQSTKQYTGYDHIQKKF